MLFINGNINSGKTTVGKILEQQIPNSEFIDVDYILDDYSNYKTKCTFPEYAELRFNKMLDFIKNIKDTKFYIFSYLFFEYRYQKIESILGNNNYLFITLNPPLNVLLEDRGDRKLSKIEKIKIRNFHELGIHNFPNHGFAIDNSSCLPTNTADMITNIIFNL